MCQIEIGLTADDQYYSLTGDIDQLLSDRRAKLYIKNYLYSTLGEDEILVPYEEDTKESILQALQELLNVQGLEESRSLEVEKALDEYLREENNFERFSEESYLIRNNQLTQEQKSQFKGFAQILLEQLPTRTLYELQLLSAYHLTFSQNACNFSVPGSGKTSIVYATYAYLRSLPSSDSKYVDKLVIIGPLSSFGPWESEYQECFGLPPNSFRLSGGTSKEDRLHHFYATNPAEISLLSYNALPILLDELVVFLKKYPTMVVLDEAHRIKNIKGGVWAKSALDIANFCRSRVILTGTPAPNGYEDIYNLFKFIWPTKDVIGFYTYQLEDMSSSPTDSRIPQLIDNVSPYFTRIRKSDLNLPEPIENAPIMVDMGEVQGEIYRYIEKNYMDFFVSHGINSDLRSMLTRARLIRLMQASINPALLIKPLEEYYLDQGLTNDVFIDDAVMFEKIMRYPLLETPQKFIAASKLITELINQDEKVIVWAIFIQNILEFKQHLESMGIDAKIIFGATPIEHNELDEEIETRESIIRDFHKSPGDFKVLIANPHAVSESISLHKACHNAIYLERSFNAATFIQSKDRIHRFGLNADDRINYFYILSRNNLDQTIHHRLAEKEARMMRIIESEPIPLFSILDSEDGDSEDLRLLIDNYVRRIF